MNSPRFLALGALALALAACGNSPAPEAATPAPAAEPVVEAAPAAEPAPAPAAAAATGSKPATVADCATTIESNDAMQYNVDSITVPATCTQFTINLKHVGTMPVAAMGHNVVIARDADMQGIAAEGMSISPEHLKADDARVIAHTRMIGGGESASVTFDVAKLQDGGAYKFFCSFPGHVGIMQGSIQVQ